MGEGHRARMTARFLKGGFDNFEEHEVLEYMLFYALPRVNTNDIAHRLLKKFGSLAGVLEAGEADIALVKGMGDKSAAYLTMFPDLLRAYKKSKIGRKPALRSIKQACEFCVAMLFGKPYEEFYVMWLNTQNRVIHSEKLSEGGIKESPVYTDKVAASALRHHAVKAIIAHNHPGGNLSPSPSDLTTTQLILNALALLNIELVDHIIVSNEQTFSFQADSLMGKREIKQTDAYAAEYSGVRQFVAVLAEEIGSR
ncbi:MAG: DNA repair protein RadC [Clostridia bacterium]|nr:DNA repair protein RadC [Clostridia bacterium]MBT7121446.1 DNA repair protein RadC [Clostridia bacterium]